MAFFIDKLGKNSLPKNYTKPSHLRILRKNMHHPSILSFSSETSRIHLYIAKIPSLTQYLATGYFHEIS